MEEKDKKNEFSIKSTFESWLETEA